MLQAKPTAQLEAQQDGQNKAAKLQVSPIHGTVSANECQ